MKLGMLPFLVLLLAAPALHAQQSSQRVCPGGSIQACIDLAQDGDTIRVEAGVYPEPVDFLGKAIHVVGVEGPTRTLIDVTGQSGPAVRFHRQEGPGSWLQGFTIRGGSADSPTPGGGISCVDRARSPASARPRISDCIIRNNHSRSGGGGVFGDAFLERCVLVENVADTGDGGGLLGTLTLRHCVVACNSALLGQGGGLFVEQGTSRLENVLILGNSSLGSGRGGGLFAATGAVLALSRCLLAENTADALGLERSLGAALFADASASVFLQHCTVAQNHATPAKFDPGECPLSGPFTLEDSIVWGNDPPASPASLSQASITYSLVEGGAPGVGVIDADPLFVDPAGLDFHLAKGSPAIDAGNPRHVDPDGSRADLGTQCSRMLYAGENASAGRFAHPGWPELSAVLGGVQHLRVNAGPDLAGRAFAMIGLAPGLRVLLALGSLDAYGRADVTVRLDPPASLVFQGLNLRSVVTVFDPIGGVVSSNLEPLIVVP